MGKKLTGMSRDWEKWLRNANKQTNLDLPQNIQHLLLTVSIGIEIDVFFVRLIKGVTGIYENQ